MLRRNWIGLVVCVFVAPSALAQNPGSLPPVVEGPGAGTLQPPVLPGPPPAVPEVPMRDLTPPGFADIVPPPVRPALPGHLAPAAGGPRGFYASAEFLLFGARRSDADFVLANRTNSLSTIGTVRSLPYDDAPGVRVELGYRFATGWDAGFAYTRLSTTGDNSVVAGPGQVILPTMTRPGLIDRVLSASGRAHLSYDAFDMLAGRRFALDDHFVVRPFGGFRFVQVRQSFDTSYDGIDAVQAVVNTRSRFTGFGPLVGLEATLAGWRGFHLYARGSGGLLAGCSREAVLETNNAGGTVYVDTAYSQWKVVPVATLAIGGGWQYRNFTIRAGYEVTQWFGLTDQPRFADDVSPGKFYTRPGNLSLDGVFIQLGFSF